MSTIESRKKLTWFKFFPADFIDVLRMEAEESDKKFKELIERLLTNRAPEGSIEARMIAESAEYSFRRKINIMKRWNPDEAERLEQQRNVDADTREGSDESTTVSAAPSMTRRPPRQPIPAPTKPKQPNLEEVYDYCDSVGIPPPIGREWYEWQDSKGWKNIRTTWQNALRHFAERRKQQ